jgi:hypothetical protein
LSPLKVHISFSLTSYDSSKKSNGNRRSNFLGLFLQSLGVTITDTDDIVFRLAYFERKHTFFTTEVSTFQFYMLLTFVSVTFVSSLKYYCEVYS